MNHEGVVFLNDHANDIGQKQHVEKLARRIRGAAEVHNLISIY